MNFLALRRSQEVEEDKNSYSSFELEDGGARAADEALAGLTGAQISLKQPLRQPAVAKQSSLQAQLQQKAEETAARRQLASMAACKAAAARQQQTLQHRHL